MVFTDIQTTRLEYGIEVRFAELVILQLQIGYARALPQVQRIELRFLVAPLTIRADQLDNPYLLALMLADLATGRGSGANRLFG